MSATNDFVTFAAASGANVMAQSDYLALPAVLTGFASGVAQSAQLNKVWRQSSIMSAVVAQFICDQTGNSATDDGTTTTLLANFKTAVQSFSRIRLAAPLTIYVATTGTDAPGKGLAVGTPFQTISYAYNFIRNNYDLNGNTATIQLANGTYSQAICSGKIVGDTGAAVTINGSATAGAVTIAASANGQGLVVASGGATFNIAGVTISAGSFTGCTGLLTNVGATILGGANLTFGAMPSGQHVQSSGQIQIGNYAITGGAGSHLIATGPGVIQVSGTNTVTGTPAFSSQFALAQNLGLVIAAIGTTYSGSATGNRYSATLNGVINTIGGGANLFPGSVAGSTSTGGQYA